MKLKKVKDFEDAKSIKELIEKMEDFGGFNAPNLAKACKILKKMIREKDCLKFLSFTANIVATGCRGIIKNFIKNNFFNILITTCGSLDHDIAKSFGSYYKGSFFVDDVSLHKKNINRIGNIFVPNKNYGILIEKKMKEFFKNLSNKEISTYEICWELGKFINKKDSILYWCYKRRVPLIVPAFFDGAVGYQTWLLSKEKKLKINFEKDEDLLNEKIWNAKKSGALIIGGGTSKHHVIWWNQFKRGLDYAVYISTSTEYDGSLSGARPKEAISWGKIKEEAKFVHLECDATLILPFIYQYLIS